MPIIFAQFTRFVITGSMNAMIDFTVYLGLTRFFDFWHYHLALATGVAFIVANTNSYFMNKYWTFTSRTKRNITEYGKFITVSMIGFTINILTFYFLVAQLGVHDLVAKVVVVGIVLMWNFTVNKFWTFSHAV